MVTFEVNDAAALATLLKAFDNLKVENLIGGSWRVTVPPAICDPSIRLPNLARNLVDFAFDEDTGEGPLVALSKGEGWRDALEEMAEVCSPKECEAVSLLLGAVGAALTIIAKRMED